jgi:hypothetical protein
MQAQLTAVVVCSFMLVVTYLLRRRSIPVKWRFMIIVLVDALSILLFIIVYNRSINLIILLALILILTVISVALHIYERKLVRERETTTGNGCP